jgi:hypothetical protein
MAETFTEAVKRSFLFPRHDKTTYTPAEMAEMLVDPYEDTPKCELVSDTLLERSRDMKKS